MQLLCISGLDDTENREIYETYMHSDQIAYTGKKSQSLGHLNPDLKALYITRFV